MLRTPHVLYIFTCKCASRYSGVQFWRIRCLKSGPKLTCFVHFYFKMYVSPQRRAFFRHLNFKKCSRTLSFLAFSLANVLFATAACIFSTCAFRHSGVQFLISPPTTWLRTRRFNRPTFGLTRHRNHWKTQHFATSLTFGADVSSFFWLSRYCIFFLLTWLLYSAFQLSILSEVSI